MLVLLALFPWTITVIALLIIILKKNKIEGFDNYDDEDFYEERQVVKVAVYEDRAYWVVDNIFYESDIIREPDFTTARPIDTMSMSQKELNKLFSILDDLEKSKNERE